MAGPNGRASVKCGQRDLGALEYNVDVGRGGRVSVVRFDRPPDVADGETLHLTLEDGRMLDCQVIDSSPFCAVVGDGPYFDRRRKAR